MKSTSFSVAVGLLAMFSMGASPCRAESTEDEAARVAQLPRPWVKPIHRISFEEYDATLKYWARQHPGVFGFEKRGESHEGRLTYVRGVTPKGMAVLDNDPGKLIANLKQLPGMNVAAMGQFLSLGPEYKFTSDQRIGSQGDPIQRGVGIRLRVPYRSPTLLDVVVNGHSLKESATDGYEAWYADGYTQVQIGVPPEKTKTADLFIVTCVYDPNERRSCGWRPPEAVMRQLEGKR